jgi:high-affinity nickel-transport protein
MTTLTAADLEPGASVPAAATRARPLLTGSLAVLVLHLGAAGLLALAAARSDVAPALVGGAVLAYLWGLQHGFAADHIAAVDDATRLLVARRHPRAGLSGLGFGIGHGLTVTAAVALVVLGVGAVPATGEAAAAALVVAVLGALSAWNARLLRRLWRGEPVGTRSLVGALGGRRLMARVGRARHLVPVGMLFGVVSAAEIVVLTQVAGRPAEGSLVGLLAVVVAFSVGLTVVDAGDGLLLARAYTWAQSRGAVAAGRRRAADIATTAATGVVSAGVATVQGADLAHGAGGVTAAPVAAVASLTERYDLLGACVVLGFGASWAVAWVVTRRAPRRDRGGAVRAR